MEIYKKINGYKNYEVSNYGSVRNSVTRKILKPQLSSNGYYNVTLSNNGERYTPTIHSLVAKHFLEVVEVTVNHKDGNKLNNNVSNLEWVSYARNLKHAHETSLRKKIHSKNSKNTSGKVGVVFDNGYWVARMHKNGKSVYIGRSKDLDMAIKMREDAENDYK